MKITKFGDGIPVALDGWSTGYQSIGSNTDSNPPLSALNFVQRITANTSNTLLNPIVNLASGSGISLAASSNTVTISATGGGGGGGTLTTIEEVDGSPTDSAVTKLVFPNGTLGIAAHVATYTPAGGTTITTKDEGSTLSSTVTTLDFVGAGVTASGAGATTTVTIPGGSGGITQAYVGYNTIGGTFETTVSNSTWYLKQVVLANDCLLTSIEAYVAAAAGTAAGPAPGVFTDSAGSPLKYIGGSPQGQGSLNLSANGARWVGGPVGLWIVAGTYWIGVRTTDLGVSATVALQIAYDVGTDVTKVQQQDYANDITGGTVTARKYSIRANTIR